MKPIDISGSDMTSSIISRALAVRLLAAAMLLLTLTPAWAQKQKAHEPTPLPVERWRAGVFAGGGAFSYDADLVGLAGVPSCSPGYQSGSGSGLLFGVAGEIPLASRLSGGLRLLFVTHTGSLKAEERQLVTALNDTVTAVFGHTIEISQPALAIEPLLSYHLIAGLRVFAGAHLDLMLGGSYHQREEIISPGEIRFENDSRLRGVYDGDLPNEARLHAAVVAGLRYDLPMNVGRTLLISPELSVWQGLTNLTAGDSWRMYGIRGGITIYYVKIGTRPPSPLDPGRR